MRSGFQVTLHSRPGRLRDQGAHLDSFLEAVSDPQSFRSLNELRERALVGLPNREQVRTSKTSLARVTEERRDDAGHEPIQLSVGLHDDAVLCATVYDCPLPMLARQSVDFFGDRR